LKFKNLHKKNLHPTGQGGSIIIA